MKIRYRLYVLFLLSIGITSACKQETPASYNEDQKTLNTESFLTYKEPHRPQAHFSPPSMWMNDPNGMFYYDGTYHLFYQHYPDSTVWGPMHWGHATSKDLVHWDNHPIALYPDSLGYIFSGSAVVDKNNTSGFKQGDEDPIVAIFTYHDPIGEQAGRNDFQSQGIAYSNDGGYSWNKYAGNPVVPNPGIRDFRDPKVIWHELSQRWVMIFAAWDHVKIYTSPDLKSWSLASTFGQEIGTHAGVWECPDLFPLMIKGTDTQKWVMLVSINPGALNGGSGTQYFIGDFDGQTFKIDPSLRQNFGKVEAVIPQGEIFADFEGPDYANWETKGTAFGPGPAQGKIGNQNPVQGYTGKGLINSFYKGDGSTGNLISPSFTIEKPYINFQLAGGNHPKVESINLVVGEETVFSATGDNSENLSWKYWDVTPYIDKQAYIEIIDQHTGGWGHICVDHIMFADAPVQPAYEKALFLDYGKDNYAGVTWSDVPQRDGRRIFMGWMSNWEYANLVPTYPWRSAMTFPREITLHQTPIGLRIFNNPVQELNHLRLRRTQLPEIPLRQEVVLTDNLPFDSSLCEMDLTFDINPENKDLQLEVVLFNDNQEKVIIGYQAKI